jgi:hypothetical protein
VAVEVASSLGAFLAAATVVGVGVKTFFIDP